MRLVYLDTSHINRLAKVALSDRRRFESFLSRWQATNSQLVLSFPHLAETRRHRAPLVREERYAFFETMLPVVTDVPFELPDCPPIDLRDREIFAALLRKGIIRVQTANTAWLTYHTDFFPARYNTSADIQVMRGLESREFAVVLDAMHTAIATGTAASALAPAALEKKARLADIPEAVLSEESAAALLKNIDQELAKLNLGASVSELIPKEVYDRELAKAREQFAAYLTRATQIGQRAAYLESVGLDATTPPRRPLDRLGRESQLTFRVRQFLERSLCVTDRADQDQVLCRLQLEDCPGFWLAEMVAAEIRRAERDPAPSNEYDLLHVQYYPYVDCFLADKRIASYVNQVRTRSAVPAVASRPPVVAVPDTLEALESALFDNEAA